MGLNQKQKEAVEYLDGPLLVLAGPGTGKTQLLSEKVAYILKNTDTSPENILCLTFTETGASNMRERLHRFIGKDSAKVNIGTYHAFGSDILAKYKNYSTTYNRKLDAAIDEVTQHKIITEIQNHLPATDILRGDSVSDIISVISEAKSASLDAADLSAIATQNLTDSEVLSKSIAPLLANVVPRVFKDSYENAYLPIYEILKSYAEGTETIPLKHSSRVERIIFGIARDLKTAIIAAESTQKIKPLSDWKDAYFEKDGKGTYRLSDRVANKKLASIAQIMQQYQDYLLQNGLYDFDDMIIEAVRVLREDDGFRMTLQERYQFVMLDEFQDTNPSQLAIVKEITDYEKPMIMAVGDDDQAIYVFQGALATNLSDFQEHYSAHVIALTENYRSTQEILDFSHDIIAQAPDRFADKILTSHKDAPKESQIYRHEFLSSVEEYGFVAKRISELIRAGVPQSEIAIISYKTKYFMPLLPYLKAYPEIKIAYEKRDNLFEDQKIHEILTISKLIYEIAHQKKQTVSLLEVLSYPCFELPILEVVKEIAAAREAHRPVFDQLLESDNSAVRTVMEFFVSLIPKAHEESLNIFLDYLVGLIDVSGRKSPFLKYYLDHAENEYEIFRFYENLAALRAALEKHFGDATLHLSDLVEMVEDYEAANMAINVKSPYRDADDAVQVLSAHKSKGLEFRYVFIISADHTAWGKGKGNNNLLSLPKNLAFIRHTGTTDGEKLRILYVALTRAKECLYITNSLHDFKDKDPKRLEYLDEHEEDGIVFSPFLPTKKVILDYAAAGQGAYEDSAIQGSIDGLRQYITSYTATNPDLRTIYRERVANWRMSASSLTSFIDITYAGPQEFFKRQILRAPSEPENESLAMGNLIHRTFEEITNTNISDEEAVNFFLSELDKRDLPIEISQSIREKGPADLAVSLKAFSDILRQGRAEIDLSREHLSVGGVPITGKIDHITIDETTKTIEIYDFKTSNYHKEKWQSHATLYKYALQLGFYKLLLNNSPTYSKYSIKKAHILFVTPDKDREVYDKVYDFTPDEETQLTQLMWAVYRQVATLNFLDDPDIFISANPENGIKEIKAFVDLLLAKSSNL